MIQQSLHPFRSGLMGNLPLDAAYLRGVEARARMLDRACRLTRGKLQQSSESAVQEVPPHQCVDDGGMFFGQCEICGKLLDW